jgi:hypothetical protein
MVEKVYIKQGDFGTTYRFTVENQDLSSFSAKIYVWSDSTGNKILDGVAATSNTYDGQDTLVQYTVAEDDFVVVGDYSAEVVFYNAGVYEDSTETFRWIVTESGDA